MRKAGLSTNGEYSIENLVFKKLRNKGYIGKLMKRKKEQTDKELSLESFEPTLKDLYEEIATGIAGMMDAQPNPVVGQVSFSKQNGHRQKKAQYDYKYRKMNKKKHDAVVEGIFDLCYRIIDLCE